MSASKPEAPNVVLEYAKVVTRPLLIGILLLAYRPPVGNDDAEPGNHRIDPEDRAAEADVAKDRG
jgi:hypothetical protein